MTERCDTPLCRLPDQDRLHVMSVIAWLRGEQQGRLPDMKRGAAADSLETLLACCVQSETAASDFGDRMRAKGFSEVPSMRERRDDKNYDATPRTDGVTVLLHNMNVIIPEPMMALARQLERELTVARSAGVALIPPGWKLVPIEPTEAMLDALGGSPWIVESDTKVIGNKVITTRHEYRDQRYVVDGWNEMLAAAPEAPVVPSAKLGRDAIIEACATVALEQRCERGTPWDLACVTIAEAIRKLNTADSRTVPE